MKRFDVLVTYDVNTTTQAGRRRLRRACRLCKNFGQRVQYSVYAVTVTRAELETLEAQLVDLIDAEQDSLHLYTLPGGRDACLRTYGIDRFTDFDGPLVV